MGIHRNKMLRTLQIGLAAALLTAAGSFALADGATYPQDEVEAAFIYRFGSFVSWPQGALNSAVFTIAVLRDEAVASDLERMVARNEVQGRPARVRSITSISELGDAQILYIGDADARILKRWLAAVAGRPILVVTGQPGGLEDGSVINFLLVNHHVRFEISVAAARRSHLSISSSLLSIATRIEGPIGAAPPCIDPTRQPRTAPSCGPRLASR